MKKLLVLLCAFSALFVNAQTFYEPNDLKVEFTQRSISTYWQSDFIKPTWSYSYLDGKGVMNATWLIEGKFITIYFGNEKTDMGVCGSDGMTNMGTLNEYVPIQLQYTDVKIEFDKIAYDPITKAVLIPYGTVTSFIGTFYNLLSVSLYDALHSNVSTTSIGETKGIQTYYNLNGQKINPETSTDKIVIKSDGTSVEKILNIR